MLGIYIFDFYSGCLYRIKISTEDWLNKYKEDISNVFEEFDINESCCQYMMSDSDLEIEDLN